MTQRIVDLTHPLRAGDSVYPGDPQFECAPHATIAADGYRVTTLTLGSHLGTHLDAPSHFVADGATVEAWPLETLVGPAVVIDVRGEPNAVIEPRDLEPFAERIVTGASVLLRTLWSKHYPHEEYWRDFPGLSPAAAEWLKHREVALLGFDTPGPSQDTQIVHEILLGGPKPTVIVESLTNLDQLPDQVMLVVLPLKLVGVDGSPVRAIAIV